METKIVRKLWALCIVTLFFGLAFTSFVNGTKLIISEGDKKEYWAVIICGGLNDSFNECFRNTARHAYQTLKKLRYDDEHIYFLQDGNITEEGVDGITNKSMVEYAIAGWLKNHADENDDCFIYFADHGGISISQMIIGLAVWNYNDNKAELIEPHELAEWVNCVTYNICTVAIDTCLSGSFIKSLSENNRIIITSTDLYRPGWGIKSNGTVENVFSYHFFNGLANNVSYGRAWEYADKQTRTIRLRETPIFYRWHKFLIGKLICRFGTRLQNPQIDDNGDGKGHGTILADRLPMRGDGYLALKTYPS